jgi:hypothetical protein
MAKRRSIMHTDISSTPRPLQELRMSARRLSLVAALLIVPTLVHAQRGGGGGGGGSSSGKFGRPVDAEIKDNGPKDATGIMLTKDLQKENMVQLILDKKKDLKLTDDEVKQLKSINDHIKDTISGPMKSLDSITSELKRRSGEQGPDRQGMLTGRIMSEAHVAEVREQYTAALKDALSKLTDDQQKAANDLINARRKELAGDKKG